MGEYPHCSQGEVILQIRIGARKETNTGRTGTWKVHQLWQALQSPPARSAWTLEEKPFFLELMRKRCAK